MKTRPPSSPSIRATSVTARLAIVAALLIAVSSLATACFSTYRSPDLGGLYNRAAQHNHPERNPIVVIPGLLGSTLEDAESGRVVWGAFTGQTAKPKDPEGARLIALPMRPGAPLAELTDGVQATRVLDKVRVRFLGLPLQLKAYFQLLGALGAGGYRDEALALSGGIDYGEGHFTCFQFPYDWRRDSVENARRLHAFLLEKQAYVQEETEKRFGIPGAEVKFDLVAHSLGGLVARYYLRYGPADLPEDGSPPALTWAGADLVERAVLVAPPNAGALEAVENLVEGRSFGGPLAPDYPAAILGTFPSAYQMLPRPHLAALISEETGEPLGDLWDPSLWEELEWGLADPDQDPVLERLLPELADENGGDAGRRREVALDHLAKSLERARRFAAALDRPAVPPPGLDLFLVAGDSKPTDARLTVATSGRHKGRLRLFSRGPGDGTVLRRSALMDLRTQTGGWDPPLRSPVAWSNVLFLFTGHLGLTKEPTFTDNVLYWLLEDPRWDSSPADRSL